MKRVLSGLALGAAMFFAMRAALHDDAVAFALAAGMFAVDFGRTGRPRC